MKFERYFAIFHGINENIAAANFFLSDNFCQTKNVKNSQLHMKLKMKKVPSEFAMFGGQNPDGTNQIQRNETNKLL